MSTCKSGYNLSKEGSVFYGACIVNVPLNPPKMQWLLFSVPLMIEEIQLNTFQLTHSEHHRNKPVATVC